MFDVDPIYPSQRYKRTPAVFRMVISQIVYKRSAFDPAFAQTKLGLLVFAGVEGESEIRSQTGIMPSFIEEWWRIEDARFLEHVMKPDEIIRGLVFFG
jgi:hypothetical protein